MKLMNDRSTAAWKASINPRHKTLSTTSMVLYCICMGSILGWLGIMGLRHFGL
jgi:hypothetical protein